MLRMPMDWSNQPSVRLSYSQLVSRLQGFDRLNNLGVDSSGSHHVYEVELGRTGAPCIYIQSSLHGNEWDGTIFALRFMEELRDNTFVDKPFRNWLLANFHLIWIPMANPWGYATDTRHNFRNVDLNRDYYDFSELETRISRDNLQKRRPFAFLDIHLMVITFNSNELVFGVGSWEHMEIQEQMVRSLEMYMSERCTRWTPTNNPPISGLARSYVSSRVDSHWLTDQPISFISEITRNPDVNNPAYFTQAQIMKAGMCQIYVFLKYSTHYWVTGQMHMNT